MGKTFVVSGIMDWLKAASIRKISAKRERNTKESLQQKIKEFKKTSEEILGGSEE